jgi:DNA-binding CsgD family transcriptional regulator
MIDDKALLAELQQIKNLLAILGVKDLHQKEQIRLLSKADFQPKEIAKLLGTTSNAVSVTLTGLKKTGSKKVKNDEQSPKK